jgi:uncharacterized protein with GYD domain
MMASYLFRFSYTTESWAALIEHPEDRRDMLASRIFGMGGHLDGFWYSLGDHDGYALVELPDNVTAAAIRAAIVATGSLTHLEATALLTADEMVEALARAREFAYRSPTSPPGAGA